MSKIDIISGFLGAGKTTLIKKLIAEAYQRSYQVRSAEVERFFKSSWYRLMTDLDEDIIIEKIRAKVKKKIMKKQKTKVSEI